MVAHDFIKIRGLHEILKYMAWYRAVISIFTKIIQDLMKQTNSNENILLVKSYKILVAIKMNWENYHYWTKLLFFGNIQLKLTIRESLSWWKYISQIIFKNHYSNFSQEFFYFFMKFEELWIGVLQLFLFHIYSLII